MVMIFIVEIILMLFFGRLLGEVMQRFGQPAVMGQLIAGVILGPSVFGHFWPAGYNVVFPDVASQKKMIDAISQLGILMLLLLTGMETDLRLVNKMRKTAFLTSLAGIVLPFICGYILGEYLPDSMIPDPQKRLVTSLFLATALSISSVKIVAMVIMEVGFLRRNVGQIILASAILDDTIGWIIIAVIAGLASSGTVNLGKAGLSLLGTILFLVFCLTIGRKMVAWVIRWTNDHLVIETPVLTAILLIMMVAAVITDLIGVHTVLGAFVVGIMVGRSPILTKNIESQLRGLIVSLFAPVFFAVAGREIDLTVMNSVSQFEVAILFIIIASVGKVSGAFLGGLLSRLGIRASTALAIGMNARGSTEVIVATIGLSLGVLNRDLFTLIVVMAIVTTLMTPPLLRWALKRIPPTGEEKERLAREEAQERQFVPNIERLLIAADASDSGKLAARLAGLFAGTHKLLTTVIDLGPEDKNATDEKAGDVVKSSAKEGARANEENAVLPGADATPVVLVNEKPDTDFAKEIIAELPKGYDMIFLGVDGMLEHGGKGKRESSLAKILRAFEGVTAVALAKEGMQDDNLDILLPLIGTDYSQRAAEVAVALAKGASSELTALHVAPPADEVEVLRRSDAVVEAGRKLVRDIKDLGKSEAVKIRTLVKVRKSAETAILSQVKRGKHTLVVVGVKFHGDDKNVSFGRRISVLIEKLPCSILIVNSGAKK
jgi:Kef-type K+ transport system membrane component KefB/nucleotide-binding universal stress UspA family protein